MKEVYIIYDLIFNSYWDSTEGSFRGIIFATHYNTRKEAYNEISNIQSTQKRIYQILSIITK